VGAIRKKPSPCGGKNAMNADFWEGDDTSEQAPAAEL